MRALVLGGGSLKGAFQAGAIQAVLESGFEPDAVYGISVGSLNATFLVHEAGKQRAEHGVVDWPKAGRRLIEFWVRNITRPEDVAVVRSRFMMGYNTLMSRFDGLLDNSPIQNLIRSQIQIPILVNSPVKLKVGAVDIINGDLIYADNEDENILDYVLASSSLPFLMPAVAIGGDHTKAFLDGGLREVAPLRQAMEDGATEIVCVACHAKRIFNEKFNYRSLLNLVERVKDITVNQIVNNDIAWAQRFVDHEKKLGHDLRLLIIRPHEPLYLNIMKFSSDDIGRLIVQGYQNGTEVLRNQGVERKV
ncbi:patatin-like phospholipase family protein [Larkinella soli]|uniref:patatin-like phospholipase family protein n=1 Tax=Larkinella soli TaxID=1770527 RepID=UPI000FFBAC90|nr:patatin-like phospholipase family protein [Larkinella soli]